MEKLRKTNPCACEFDHPLVNEPTEHPFDAVRIIGPAHCLTNIVSGDRPLSEGSDQTTAALAIRSFEARLRGRNPGRTGCGVGAL